MARTSRIALAALTALALAPGLITSRAVQAGPYNGSAMTDFDRATPASASLYLTVQSTSADQATNLARIGAILGPRVAAAFNSAAGGGAGGAGGGAASVTAVISRFKTVFNGEYGLAAVLGTGAAAKQPHALIELGLQPGLGAQGFMASLSLLGLTATPKGSYHGVALQAVNLGALSSIAGGLTGGAAGGAPGAPSTGSSFYLGVLGNNAVIGTDLPTLKASVDAYAGSGPSVSSTSDFAKTVGRLPHNRFVTLFLNVSSSQSDALSSVTSVTGTKLSACKAAPAKPGSLAVAASLTAEPDGVLLSTSPTVATGSMATNLAFKPTSNSGLALFPASTISFASLGDPGAIIGGVVAALSASGTLSSLGCNAADPAKAFTQSTGLDLNNDVLSWMHGELSFAVLPVGSKAYKDKGDPLAYTSVVVALKIQNQALVEAKLAKIIAAANAHSAKADRVKVIVVPGPGGVPMHVAANSPTGLGYAFYKGYLLIASSLSNDLVAAQKGGGGASAPVQAALAHFGPGPYSGTFYLNLTALRTLVEKAATATGTDMKSYNASVKPLLEPFKSFSAVSFANGNGTAEFIGISK